MFHTHSSLRSTSASAPKVEEWPAKAEEWPAQAEEWPAQAEEPAPEQPRPGSGVDIHHGDQVFAIAKHKLRCCRGSMLMFACWLLPSVVGGPTYMPQADDAKEQL